jgi:catechol 2,3-dioxygenase-like lactoylglutathione lyase family enzyme
MPTTSAIQGLDFLILPTRDLKRAESFYCDVLGLKVGVREGQMAIEFDLGSDLTLALVDWERIGQPFEAVRAGVVALKVADVDAAVSGLSAMGVDFDRGSIDTGVCKMAYFRDPDGNRLMLHNRYAP